MASATFLSEISDSLGRRAVRNHTESIYTMGFLSIFWSAIFLIAAGIWRHSFIFSLASLPFFAVRSILEILQLHMGILAIVKSERSSYGFIRTMTVPLLLIADLALGYAIGLKQIIGIIIIFLALIILFLDRGINRRGVGFVIFSAVNAVLTISLFKYDIAHFNSVEAEQSIIYIILMIYLFLALILCTKKIL
ncbi:MAG: hypothetical protein UV75_C0003G0011 [Candidatus Giovannonibacteria bacterium GW2011_GWA1_43_15]|nr:MAG: hypothetical protein UV75_C0003G0011 [Candidatus Giovannonibacteria bacterium GW2011_GWA1_43_15]KKT21429.1 MAG: hypothetical protein UW05_C0010G0009 [Candidatus Giovannonibacteria bacterium GW2011_GWC2_43_8]KKT63479.1 MAG: hypothetical protein UW55_C0003G0047 [Candidatus Giovannonibacteria bacterium GW2011_GWA2_44_26]